MDRHVLNLNQSGSYFEVQREIMLIADMLKNIAETEPVRVRHFIDSSIKELEQNMTMKWISNEDSKRQYKEEQKDKEKPIRQRIKARGDKPDE